MRTKQKIILFVVLFIPCLSCSLFPAKERTFENERFAFTIPSGWKTMQEIWDLPAVQENEYYGLGVQEIVMIQYPPQQGKGNVFFGAASSPLADGETLESRFTAAYESPLPEIEDAERQPYELNGLSGYEITYRRPWGEPWWKFRDIWLEKDGVIYVLSFHSSPGSFDGHSELFQEILDSFYFKE